jgi:SAM-dependent methyltransferase
MSVLHASSTIPELHGRHRAPLRGLFILHLMGSVTPRLTGMDSSHELDYRRLDFDAFMRWKKYRIRKDAGLVDHLTERIDGSLEGNDVVRILDIGTGDGGLCFTALKQALVSRNHGDRSPQVELTCVEPVAEADQLIRRQTAELPSTVTVSIAPDIIQDFAAQPYARSFDLILCTHTLYHVPREEWGGLFCYLWRVLRPGGSMVLVMCPRAAPVYAPLGTVVLPKGTPRLFSEYGLDLYAEDLIDFVASRGWEHQVQTCPGPLVFQPAEVAVFHRCPHSLDGNTVLDSFSFLYRLPKVVLVQLMLSEIQALMKEYALPDGSVAIPLGDVCVQLNKPEQPLSELTCQMPSTKRERENVR